MTEMVIGFVVMIVVVVFPTVWVLRDYEKDSIFDKEGE